jgi:hypothetical protein
MEDTIIFHCDVCAAAVPNENTIYLTDLEELKKIIESDHLTAVKIEDCNNCFNIVHNLYIENTKRYNTMNPLLFESLKYLEHHTVFTINTNSIEKYILNNVTKKKEVKIITMEEFIAVIKEGTAKYIYNDIFKNIINIIIFI